ncbi:MAG: glycosyltransferase [Chloroflexi bacterium]|jgi:glycosyltransferase involved in cell wall biosynthesis|nr:glycosyltransferase [Chloroflexota bacterium]
MTKNQTLHIAVVLPCYNEAITIQQVIADFRAQLPDAEIHVFDNNSSDDSAKLAAEAGAIVHSVRKQGKGYVIQKAFEIVVVDALVMADGDGTYFAEDVHKLLEPVLSGNVDMVVGDRLPTASDENMRWHRHLGNRLIVWSINFMFRTRYRDILSGYRVFSRRFVQNVPLLTPGFETETEMTLQALEEGMEIIEMPISYRSRPADSHSKLNAVRDGYRIMLTAAILLRDHNPLRVFGLLAFVLLLAALVLLALTLAGNLSLLIYSALLALLSASSFGLGLVLNAVNTRFRQLKQIMQRK